MRGLICWCHSVRCREQNYEIKKTVVFDVQIDDVSEVSGINQALVIGSVLFLLFTSDLPDTIENNSEKYSDDSKLLV